MAQFPARSDDARKTAKPRREGRDPSPRLRIESVRRGASGTADVAVGGSSFLLLLEVLEGLGLSADELVPGVELDEAQGSLLALAAEAHEAEKRALFLLARAEQSRFMLAAKLERRGFSKAATLALERLASAGLLDDRRFARAYASSRLSRRAEGPSSLAAALRARGIDSETVASALAELLGPEGRAAALRKTAAKEMKRSAGDRGEARRRLRALGFSATEIGDYFERGED
jgi:SOS response regulatory protein OraA/RecX